MNLSTDPITIPDLNMPGYTLQEINGIGDFTSKAGGPGNLNKLSELTGSATPMADLDQVTQRITGYEADIVSVSEGTLNDVQTLAETIEQHASKVEGMEELEKQSGVIDGHKANLEDFKNPDKAKDKAVELAVPI